MKPTKLIWRRLASLDCLLSLNDEKNTKLFLYIVSSRSSRVRLGLTRKVTKSKNEVRSARIIDSPYFSACFCWRTPLRILSYWSNELDDECSFRESMESALTVKFCSLNVFRYSLTRWNRSFLCLVRFLCISLSLSRSHSLRFTFGSRRARRRVRRSVFPFSSVLILSLEFLFGSACSALDFPSIIYYRPRCLLAFPVSMKIFLAQTNRTNSAMETKSCIIQKRWKRFSNEFDSSEGRPRSPVDDFRSTNLNKRRQTSRSSWISCFDRQRFFVGSMKVVLLGGNRRIRSTRISTDLIELEECQI